jgi:hypothetical protein
MNQPLYIATHDLKYKVIACSYSVFLVGVAAWFLRDGDALMIYFAAAFLVKISLNMSEPFCRRLILRDSGLEVRNMFGRSRSVRHEDVDSLTLIVGRSLVIHTRNQGPFTIQYGDLPKIVRIIGEKTNGRPPLETLEEVFRWRKKPKT